MYSTYYGGGTQGSCYVWGWRHFVDDVVSLPPLFSQGVFEVNRSD